MNFREYEAVLHLRHTAVKNYLPRMLYNPLTDVLVVEWYPPLPPVVTVEDRRVLADLFDQIKADFQDVRSAHVGDIHPNNSGIDAQGQVKVLDFGGAQVYRTPARGTGRRDRGGSTVAGTTPVMTLSRQPCRPFRPSADTCEASGKPTG